MGAFMQRRLQPLLQTRIEQVAALRFEPVAMGEQVLEQDRVRSFGKWPSGLAHLLDGTGKRAGRTLIRCGDEKVRDVD